MNARRSAERHARLLALQQRMQGLEMAMLAAADRALAANVAAQAALYAIANDAAPLAAPQAAYAHGRRLLQDATALAAACDARRVALVRRAVIVECAGHQTRRSQLIVAQAEEAASLAAVVDRVAIARKQP